jgi:hypothetical protein
MWSGVSIVCFAASYSVSLSLEISRLFFRAPVRLAVMVGFAAAGLLAHTIFLWTQAREVPAQGAPLSNWRDWCLVMAWLLAIVYLTVAVRHPRAPAGLLILPVALALIALAALCDSAAPFSEQEALLRWSIVHSAALLLGTVAVMLGFVAGLMYLAQSHRLKRRRPARRGFDLPSLEWLQRVNKQALFYSSLFIFVGLAAGILLNVIRGAFLWTDLVVLTSGVLLLWLAAALLFEYLYKPARQGRKVAYLTVASFVFLGLVLAFVLYAGH